MDPSLITLGRPLPAGTRIIESQRDFLIISLPLPAARQHLGVIWDSQRDEHVLDCVTALSYRDQTVRANVIALAMTKGALTVWYSSTKNLEQDRTTIQAACDAALLSSGQRWTVAPLVPVSINSERDRRILDRGNLIESHPLHTFPTRYQLGVIEVTR
jgi:hypothetical protein